MRAKGKGLRIETQKRSRAARLEQAAPSLAATYAQALSRWVGNPVLRLSGAAQRYGILPVTGAAG